MSNNYEFENESVANAVDRIINQHLEKLHREVRYSVWSKLETDNCGWGSPIEKMLFAAISVVPWLYWGETDRCFPSLGRVKDTQSEKEVTPHLIASGLIFVSRQFPIGKYKADIVIMAALNAYNRCIKVAIECDGHDFHEKTKQQASKDKARDRYMQSKGWSVLRFTGSDIFKDPMACAEEISKFVETSADRIFKEARQYAARAES